MKEDEYGRLGLIDYGQVKQIGVDARVNIARLCIALMNNDTEEIVRIQRDDVGLKTKHNDPWVLYKHARIAWDNASRETCEGKNVQLFVEELDRRDPILVNPDAYVLPVRMCMMLWGLAYHLHYNHRVCEKLAPMARELLRREDPTFLDRYDERMRDVTRCWRKRRKRKRRRRRRYYLLLLLLPRHAQRQRPTCVPQPRPWRRSRQWRDPAGAAARRTRP